MRQNIGNWLARRALLSPNREAYVDSHTGERVTFLELNERCSRLANAFLDQGIEKEERVALLLMNCSEFMEAFFALAKIGAIVVPLNWRLVADELEFILKDSGAKQLIFDDAFIDIVTELHKRGEKTDISKWLQLEQDEPIASFARPYREFRDAASDDEPDLDVGDHDLLYIMYTSGTTGLPKGVVHTHWTATWAVLTFAATCYIHDNDRFLSPLPMFHVGALTPLTLTVYKGITCVVMRTFDPLRMWQLVEEENITIGLAVPAMLNFMLQVGDVTRFDVSSWRWCLTGAAPVPESLIETYADLGIEVHQVYGLTESCGPACVIDAENALKKVGSTGKPFFHTDVRIVRPDGTDCDVDEAGEILVKGDHVMLEYWNRPEATRETIVDDWLHTGDVARQDQDGFIYIQDRIKDMVISGGENVYPAEIENLLQTHPDIDECAVIGQPSERWGESPFAIVVSKNSDLTSNDVMKFLDGKLARYKLPQEVVFVDSVPRNPSGKILKFLLREQYPGPAPT